MTTGLCSDNTHAFNDKARESNKWHHTVKRSGVHTAQLMEKLTSITDISANGKVSFANAKLLKQ